MGYSRAMLWQICCWGKLFTLRLATLKRDTLHQRWTATNLFAQDDIRGCTETYVQSEALRYEFVTPIVDQNGLAATVVISKPFTPGVPQSGTATTILAGTNGLCDKCTYLPDRNNIAPRVGVAYDVLVTVSWP